MKFSQHNNALAVLANNRNLARNMGRLWLLLAALVLGQIGLSNSVNAAEVNAKQTVQLNTATTAELAQGLVGVGERRAQAIVDYRQKVGDFRNEDELSQVKGIGAHVLKANKKRRSYAPSSTAKRATPTKRK
ncbi:MAG: helix-hairpin-helix domain-containing protein [Pseudomonadota bacterium]|nr:helix-hairpin-helix domain-containing protein [Pseudomonadota bacterium]